MFLVSAEDSNFLFVSAISCAPTLSAEFGSVDFLVAPRFENEFFCSEVPPELEPKKSFLKDSTCDLFADLITPPSDKDDLSAVVALLVGVRTPGLVESPVAIITGFPPLASLYLITSDLKTG